jgi:hypothetical protein
MVAKNDDVFDLDDVLEIFGTQPKAGRAVPAKPAVSASAAAEVEALTEEEQRLLEEYERGKRERQQHEERARQAKQAEERRILEEYERGKREARERQEREHKAAEQKHQAEIESLRQQHLMEEARKQEEKRILADYERARRARAEQEKAEQEAGEAQAQQALKDLAQRQQEEPAAVARPNNEKHQRLLDLLGKVQRDLKAGRPLSLDPLPVPPSSRLPPLPGLPVMPTATATAPESAPASAPLPAAETGLESAAAPNPAVPVEVAPVFGEGAEPAPAFTRADLEGSEVESGFNDAFCYMLDETRKAVFSYLAPVIGIKAANIMLTKTLEKARSCAAAMLKDANWRTDGTLREDGSLDADRLLKNAISLPPEERSQLYVQAMHEILNLRLQAVGLGLGSSAREELLERLHLLRVRSFVDRGVRPEWITMFYNEVVPH